MKKTTHTSNKMARILAYLLTGASLNRFEAERLGDHCLNSTISALANRHDLKMRREPERVPNHWGRPCRVLRYSLPRSEYNRAISLLAYLLGPTPPDNED